MHYSYRKGGQHFPCMDSSSQLQKKPYMHLLDKDIWLPDDRHGPSGTHAAGPRGESLGATETGLFLQGNQTGCG